MSTNVKLTTFDQTAPHSNQGGRTAILSGRHDECRGGLPIAPGYDCVEAAEALFQACDFVTNDAPIAMY